ncbi:DUF2269 family protein [Leptolyngbya sp. NIES-2104]|uniref:DUF2269 family protein n=1 Tax=Leptolyngbya sp. NIES-2104 TaxID=1552121 RepID=UPI0006EC67BF|nr:DUF2269 family protein [Leptolyngbya sp. NIES-2104]GAP99996.1 hypothetical protein NIES2104_65620 [Leptolyngbya sp. NIES-2104]
MKLNVKQRNWLLSLHIASGGLWFGTALCSVVLALSFRSLNDGDGIYGINTARNLLGEFVIVPSAILSVVTGALLCAFTNWGFFKHFWVMAKQLVTLILIVVGSVWLGPWTKEMTAISEVARSQALQNPSYLSLQSVVAIGGALQTLALLIIIAISTVKPWGKRKTTRTTT